MDTLENPANQRLVIDIFSDVVCPWCFIGKHHLEAALHKFSSEQPQVSISVRWLPYFLNPDTPPEGDPYRPFLEKKFGGPARVDAILARVNEAGKSAGLEFAFEKIKLRANTMSAHRLIHRIQQRGDANALVERIFAAHFQRGEHIGDPDALAQIAVGCGDDLAAVHAYLASSEGASEILAQAGQAQEAGISGVPFFIFNGRLAASGAQPPEEFLRIIYQVFGQGRN